MNLNKIILNKLYFFIISYYSASARWFQPYFFSYSFSLIFSAILSAIFSTIFSTIFSIIFSSLFATFLFIPDNISYNTFKGSLHIGNCPYIFIKLLVFCLIFNLLFIFSSFIVYLLISFSLFGYHLSVISESILTYQRDTYISIAGVACHRACAICCRHLFISCLHIRAAKYKVRIMIRLICMFDAIFNRIYTDCIASATIFMFHSYLSFHLLCFHLPRLHFSSHFLIFLSLPSARPVVHLFLLSLYCAMLS